MKNQITILHQSFKPFEVRDLMVRIIGIPSIAVIMFAVLHKGTGNLAGELKGFFICFIYTLAYWQGLRQVWMMLQNRFPHYSQTGKRMLLLAVIVIAYGVLISFVIECLAALLLNTNCTIHKIVKAYFIGLIPTFLVLMAYETVYFFYSWRDKVIESEAIVRTHLVSQLDALKNQLDPHFLFNSLNTLSSLIDENEPAQKYLSRLADIYRYVLISKDKNTVTLKEEMEFVNAYLYLAKVRFSSGLSIEIDIPEQYINQMVAPLSVQLLVENALKHNVITKENPLTVELKVQDGFLWVKNEIKPKVHFESSTKVGLKNIMERYRLLTSIPVQILNEANRFEVALPLMVG